MISKSLGGLILFEPFHPCIYDRSAEFCYSGSEINPEILGYLNSTVLDPPENPWLLRNHLPEPIEDVSKFFIEYLWRNTSVLGWKTIRANHCLTPLATALDAQVIYIYRHPLAVLNSLKHRPNFWKEYGWERHKELFFNQVYTSCGLDKERVIGLKSLLTKLVSVEEIIIFMWAVSMTISVRSAAQIGAKMVSYEDLYINPYKELRKIFKYLQEQKEIHPSHIFWPSMTTLNTLHSKRVLSDLSREDVDQMFWKFAYTDAQSKKLLEIVESVILEDEESRQFMMKTGYLAH